MTHTLNRPFLHVLALVAMVSILTSCASGSETLKGYDMNNFRKREIVLLLSDSMQIIPFTESFASFTKDGIDTSIVRHRVDSAFRFGLGTEYYGARVRIDSHLVATGPVDTIGYSVGSERIVVPGRWQGLDANALYLRTSAMLFMDGYSSGGRDLNARASWLVYDPAIGKAVAGGKLDEHSSTSVVVTRIITQSDWYAASRRAGIALAETIGYLR